MNMPDTLDEQSSDEQDDLIQASFLNRLVARTIDFIIVVALLEIIPKIGYFAGLAYILIADGLFQGRSVGKKLLGLKVVFYIEPEEPIECSIKESIYRNFPFAAGYILYGILGGIPLIGWLLSFVAVVGIMLFESLLIVGNDRGMRFGDEIAKTRVVEDKQGGLNV